MSSRNRRSKAPALRRNPFYSAEQIKDDALFQGYIAARDNGYHPSESFETRYNRAVEHINNTIAADPKSLAATLSPEQFNTWIRYADQGIRDAIKRQNDRDKQEAVEAAIKAKKDSVKSKAKGLWARAKSVVGRSNPGKKTKGRRRA